MAVAVAVRVHHTLHQVPDCGLGWMRCCRAAGREREGRSGPGPGRRVLSPIVGTGVYFRNIYVMYLRSPTLQFENVQIDACVDATVCKIPSPDSK